MKLKWLPKPVGEMSIPVGETVSLIANIAGEMSVDDVPLATWADLQAIKAGDESPLEVVVEVPVGRSKRGWNYKANALQSIVGEVMAQGLPGFLGHQKPEEISTQFPTPVTHWVGAKFDPNIENKDSSGKVISKGAAYFRGVVDKSADDLKRWIKAKVVRQVSIFGYPKIQKVAGEINVVDYKPLSLDWTPLNRPGMPTRIVAFGEIDVIGELDGSQEELREALRAAVREKMSLQDNEWVYVDKTFDDHVIVEHSGANMPQSKFYRFNYAVIDGNVQLGEKAEVEKKTTYEPVGTKTTGEIDAGGSDMNWKELVAKLKAMLASGEVTRAQVVGEMGWDAQAVAGEIDANWVSQMTGATETLNKVKEALGVSGEMDVITVAQAAASAVIEHRKAGRDVLVDEVLKEKVTGEMAQGLVRKMLNVAEDATKEQVAGEIDRILADDNVKAAIGKMHVDKPPFVGGGSSGNQSTTLRTKRQSI